MQEEVEEEDEVHEHGPRRERMVEEQEMDVYPALKLLHVHVYKGPN